MLKFLATLSVLVVAVSAKPPKEMCNPQYLIQAKSCCSSLPKVYTEDDFKACKSASPFNGAPQTGDNKSRTKREPEPLRPRSGPGGPGGPPGGRFGPPFAVINCMLKNKGHVDDNYVLNKDALINSFSAVAETDVWKFNVTNVINECFKNLSAAALPAPPADAPAIGKPDGLLVLSCIQTGLLLSCPTADRINLDTVPVDNQDIPKEIPKFPAATCSQRFEELGQCNPFFVPKRKNRGARKGDRRRKQNTKIDSAVTGN
ncbi:uncharacterized protein LOC132195085 [Neocloeon triangulifer]|uniref:uncharacterized protein LOC132195085 n=1 Tax=Neocloeon triangulifer TaxID=2078957 RepID=UPI00286FA406|nr:uncharacterized protein LOC132195085 [Neocloeon triangulifer]